MTEPRHGRAETGAIVVVPERPGPLIHLNVARARGQDDLDQLIDELFPDADEQPGWFDVGLVVAGLGVLGWGTVGGGPTLAAGAGAIAVALGCILPARSVWRRIQRARRARRRSKVLARGIPMRPSDASVQRLVQAYEALCGFAGAPGITSGGSAIAAGHSAMIEAASLLRCNVNVSAEERAYTEERAAAIEELTTALREQQAALPADTDVNDEFGDTEPAALLQARREMDAIAGFNSLTRLRQLSAEVWTRRGRD